MARAVGQPCAVRARQALRDTIGIVDPVLYGAEAEHGPGPGEPWGSGGAVGAAEAEEAEEIELLFGKHPPDPDHAADSPDEELFKSP